MAEIGVDVGKAAQILTDGGIVGIPTETVYGLAANALNPVAVLKVFKAKARPHFDPLIVHCRDQNEAFSHALFIPDLAKKLAAHFWPGPLTLLLPKQSHIPDEVTSGLESVGLRVPAHLLTQELLATAKIPLAAPSANPFQYVSPTTAQHVQDQLGRKVDYILDGGACGVGLESTIVGFDRLGPVIYRLGGLSQCDIEAVIGPVRVSLNQSSNPVAPGQLKNHYAPNLPVIIYPTPIPEPWLKNGFAYLGFDSVPQNLNPKEVILLSERGLLDEAARNLFSAMRKLGGLRLSGIVAAQFPDTGLGAAINDRLQRAAAV